MRQRLQAQNAVLWAQINFYLKASIFDILKFIGANNAFKLVMLTSLIECIDKNRKDKVLVSAESQVTDFSSTTLKEDLLLSSLSEGVTLTFNQNDILVKIDMPSQGKAYDEFLKQWDIKAIPDKTLIIEKLGEPTYIMKYPPQRGDKQQLMYNKQQYWLIFKISNQNLESISFVSPSLIAPSIKSKFVPIRICKSKD